MLNGGFLNYKQDRITAKDPRPPPTAFSVSIVSGRWNQVLVSGRWQNAGGVKEEEEEKLAICWPTPLR